MPLFTDLGLEEPLKIIESQADDELTEAKQTQAETKDEQQSKQPAEESKQLQVQVSPLGLRRSVSLLTDTVSMHSPAQPKRFRKRIDSVDANQTPTRRSLSTRLKIQSKENTLHPLPPAPLPLLHSSSDSTLNLNPTDSSQLFSFAPIEPAPSQPTDIVSPVFEHKLSPNTISDHPPCLVCVCWLTCVDWCVCRLLYVLLIAERSQFEVEEENWLLEEERLRLQLEPTDDILFHYNCIRIEGLQEIHGVLLLCTSNLYIVDHYEITASGDIIERESTAQSVSVLDSIQLFTNRLLISSDEVLQLPAAAASAGADPYRSYVQRHKCRKWSYFDVLECHKRRFLLRESAVELFFSDGSNHLLVVNLSQRDTVYQQLKDKCPNIFTAGVFHTLFRSDWSSLRYRPKGGGSKAILRSVQSQWVEGKMSNFEYLMHLNSFAGRTFNDLTQYPVFPWILSDYSSEFIDLALPQIYRDLSKSMGAQSEKRAEEFKMRYELSNTLTEELEALPKFFYGTHYSSPATVLHFLIRLEPFTQHSIQLQGGKFDHSDRLFHSLAASWVRSSERLTSDVQELIPEFFFLPEFLRNGNHLPLGAAISDVQLPKWAHSNTRQFIRIHRRALESDYVSAYLHLWIDLIFGYKQQGEAAREAMNLFHPYTYAGQVDFDSIADENLREATIEHIRSFGQTPLQLFSSPHPPKHRINDTPLLLSLPLRPHFEMVHLKAHSFTIGSIFALKQRAESSKQEQVTVLAANQLLLPHKPDKFLSWGHADGTIRICSLANSKPKTVYTGLHEGVVRVAGVSADGSKLVTGGDDCLICIWRLLSKKNKYYIDQQLKHALAHSGSVSLTQTHIDLNTKPKRSELSRKQVDGKLLFLAALHGHMAPITCLMVSSPFSLIVSGSADRSVIVWDLNRCVCLRQFKALPGAVSAVDVNQSTGDVVACAKFSVFVWSVNGELLASHPQRADPCSFISSVVIANLAGHEMQSGANMVATGHRDGVVRLWDMVFNAENKSNWQLEQKVELRGCDSAITALLLSEDLNCLWSGDKEGVMMQWAVKDVEFKHALNNYPGTVSESQRQVAVKESLNETDRSRSNTTHQPRVPTEPCSCQGSKQAKRYWCEICSDLICTDCRLSHLREQHPRIEYSPPLPLAFLSSQDNLLAEDPPDTAQMQRGSQLSPQFEEDSD